MTMENIGESVVNIPAPSVLCVDDDPGVLLALRRTLCRSFSVDGASSAEQALELLSKKRYAVVITDLALPVMNGIEFSSKAREVAPEVTRLLLASHSVFQEVVAAANTGQVYRFLPKPFQSEHLLATVADAAQHHRRVVADRCALQQTLAGIVATLTEFACQLRPDLAERAQWSRRAAHVLANAAGVPETWQIEAASLATLLACLRSPTAHWLSAIGLAETKTRLLQTSVSVARTAYQPLPQFRQICDLLEAATSDAAQDEQGSRVIRLILRWQAFAEANLDPSVGLEELRSSGSAYPDTWLDALQSLDDNAYLTRQSPIRVDDLRAGMILAADLVAQGEKRQILVRQGAELTRPVLERVRNYARSSGVVEPVLVVERVRVQVRREPAVRRAAAVGADTSVLGDPTVSGTWRTK